MGKYNNSEYGELFGDLFSVRNELGEIADRIDITDIPALPETDSSGEQYKGAVRIVNKIKNLPSKKFFMYKEGHHLMPSMPVLKNNDVTVVIGDTGHTYPRMGVGNFNVDIHTLVARCFIPNGDPTRRHYVDHINEDNLEHCLEVLKRFDFKVCRPHQCDWRPTNLRWATNGENVKWRKQQNFKFMDYVRESVSGYSEERPWGSFTILDEGEGFKVKRISVKPNQRLSLQYHNHRKEYWTVVSGIALVTVGDICEYKDAGMSVSIPKGAHHRLANEEETDMLELIEVQYGDYLEEDDIVRLEDDYNRPEKLKK
jgi:mannose-6-phosphate isomerase-like protein (cupin superfamily)